MVEDRNFETRFPYIIDTDTGADEGIMDLTKMSEEELINLFPGIPEAMMELVYRELVLGSEGKD